MPDDQNHRHHRNHYLNLQTTQQIINRTTKTFIYNIFTFLVISLLVLTFRIFVESGALIATSYIDRDPSLQSLLAKLDISGTSSSSTTNSNNNNRNDRVPSAADTSNVDSLLRRRRRMHRQHRSFLYITRVGVRDDGSFSSDDEYDEEDRNVFRPYRKRWGNSSYLKFSNFDPRLGFSEFVDDNGVRVSEIVRSGFSFNVDRLSFNGEEVDDSDNGTISFGSNEDGRVDDDYGDSDSKSFMNRFDMDHHDSMALLVIASFMCVAYSWVIIGFVVTYTWVLGVVFVAVVNYLLGRYCSFFSIMRDGSRIGMKKLSAFILMRWALRDAFTQLLGLWFFGEVEDQYSFFRLFLRLKLMPFSIVSPWIRGFEKEIASFLYMWFVVDTVVAFIFALDPWAAIVGSRRAGRNIVKEGCYLISLMLSQALHIKIIEILLCGPFLRWILYKSCGKFIAYLFQSLAEVYVMVAWLIFYFAAKCKDPNPNGRRFGLRDLEGLVEDLR